jgi:RimJ/RimL family protein N-acetyltransferase
MELRKVEFSDWQHLLAWRNDFVTRKNCEVDDIVEESGHKAWLSPALTKENFLYYIAIENDIPVGTIRGEYDPGTKTYKVSWTTSPDHRNRGVAKKMATLFCSMISEKIKVEIKTSDIFSVKIAEHVGMTFLKEVNGKKYYYKAH